MRYFDYLGGLTMTNRRFDELFDGPPREPESEITQREMDLARSIQEVTEEIVLRMARARGRDRPVERNACLAGGVALNCVANGRLLREGPFERIWVQPAAGDAGGAVGAALYGWHQIARQPARAVDGPDDGMQRRLPRAPASPTTRSRATWTSSGYPYERLADRGARAGRDRRAGRRRQGRRAVHGPHGVRAPRPRAPLDPRRPPLARDAVDHEPEDQVPRVVPALRARRSWPSGPPTTSTSTSSRPYMMLVAAVREAPAHGQRPRPHATTCATGSTRCAPRSPPSPTSTTRPACRP